MNDKFGPPTNVSSKYVFSYKKFFIRSFRLDNNTSFENRSLFL